MLTAQLREQYARTGEGLTLEGVQRICGYCVSTDEQYHIHVPNHMFNLDGKQGVELKSVL